MTSSDAKARMSSRPSPGRTSTAHWNHEEPEVEAAIVTP